MSATLLTADLFESVPDVRPSQEAMAEGAVLLRGFARPIETDLIAALARYRRGKRRFAT